MHSLLIVEVVMKVFRWGDDIAVELPKAVVEVIRKVDRRAEALENMRRRAWSAPADYTFDRDEANER